MANATAYKYQLQSLGTQPNGTISSAASFTTDAPNLYDGSPGDTGTSYTASHSGSGEAGVQALIDLGAGPPSITRYRWNGSGNNGFGSRLYYSDDGTAWTAQAAASSTNAVDSGTIGAVTHRYWQLTTWVDNLGSESCTLSDFRLYDSGGVLIGGPAGAVAVNAGMLMIGV